MPKRLKLEPHQTSSELSKLYRQASDPIERSYNQLGANGLKDKRHPHPGTPPLLSVVEQAQLLQTLGTPTADGGLWNSRKVAEWISNLLERPVSVQRGWDYRSRASIFLNY
jgi:hypothetical protein